MVGDHHRSAADLPAHVAAMATAGFYEHRPERVVVHETHISWVFVAGDLAYKVKKPLSLPYLNYGTLERRRHMCEEEVRLNRRLAPDLYLGVRSLIEAGHGGFRLSGGDDPAAIEFAVEMRAFPEERELSSMLVAGIAGPPEIEAVAARLARFHREAPIPDEPLAAVPNLLAALEENLETLRADGGAVIPPSRLEAAERFTRAFLDSGGTRELMERAEGGAVREGHGDLRAEHVLLTDPIQIYDCVEFDPALREIDVAVDIAFLVMDLERVAGREVAEGLAQAYREAGGDLGGRGLLDFLAAYRAWVRAKVALSDPDPRGGRRRATALHALGHRFAWRARRPLVLCLCGVAASGKSTLAAELADVSGFSVVAADPTRKRLAGLEPSERAGAVYYSREFGLRTYEEVGRLAAAELERSGGVIVDATCRRREDRDALREGLGRVRAPLLFARCVAPRSVILARAREREREPGRVSDADLEVVEAQLGEFEDLEEVPPPLRGEIATEAPLAEQAVAAEALLDRARFAS